MSSFALENRLLAAFFTGGPNGWNQPIDHAFHETELVLRQRHVGVLIEIAFC